MEAGGRERVAGECAGGQFQVVAAVVLASVLGITDAEVQGREHAAVEIEFAVGGEPVFLVLGIGILQSEHGGGRGMGQRTVQCAIAADVPVQRRGGAAERPAGAGIGIQRHFQRILARSLAVALGGAAFEFERQAIRGLPVGIQSQIAAVRFRDARDLVVDRERDAAAGGRIDRIGEYAVAQRVRVGYLRGGELARPQHVIAVVIVRVQLGVEAVQIQGERVGGLVLDVERAALSLAFLGEQGGADQVRVIGACQIGIGQCGGRGGGNLAITADDFLAVAAQAAALVEGLDQNAEVAICVFPVHQAAELRFRLAREVRVDGAQRGLAGEVLFEVQRLAGADVDGARGTAFHQLGLRALVDDDLIHDFGREQGIADAAADVAGLVGDQPVAGADKMAIDQRLGKAGRRAAHAHTLAFVEAALAAAGCAHVDAGHALQRVRDVFGGQLADVLGADDLDVGGSFTLAVQGFLHAAADAHHAYGVQIGGVLLGRFLRVDLQREAQASDDGGG